MHYIIVSADKRKRDFLEKVSFEPSQSDRGCLFCEIFIAQFREDIFFLPCCIVIAFITNLWIDLNNAVLRYDIYLLGGHHPYASLWKFATTYLCDDRFPRWQTAVDMVSSGKVDVKPLVTHHFPLEKTVDAFEAAKTGAGIKIIIDCFRS